MESNIETASDSGGTLTINNFSQSAPWTGTSQTVPATPNSTLLFIAVEYVKDTNEYKFNSEVGYSPQATSPCNGFEQHVSPLDPNMSSTACYSPSSPCTDADVAYNNPIVVQHLISTDSEQPLINNNTTNIYAENLPNRDASLVGSIPTSLSSSDTALLKQVVANKYLLNQQAPPTNISAPDVLQLVTDPDSEQEVELLITDQETGISYNVSAQEYLVERCLADEQQLLDAFAPGPLLDTELLGLDENALKSQLPDIVETVNTAAALSSHSLDVGNSIITDTSIARIIQNEVQVVVKKEDENFSQENLRRSQRQIDMRSQTKQQLLTEIHTITDKPVESRAKATLPASYLAIIKHDEGQYGVYARKMIPKRTQFGPVEGILIENNTDINDNGLQLLVDCGTGVIHRMDVSDENVANWMCFVRKATNYEEQNLLISQQGDFLYYTTTTNIWPKQELLVGYCETYANKYSLLILQPLSQKENDWPCFECDKRFASSQELQNHLNVHDDIKKDGIKLKKKTLKCKKRKIKKGFSGKPSIQINGSGDLHTQKMSACNTAQKKFVQDCNEINMNNNLQNENILQNQITHQDNAPNITDKGKFEELTKRKCEKCDVYFKTEELLQMHTLQHKVDAGETLTCPDCRDEFNTQQRLIEHISNGCNVKSPELESKGYKCPICYKIFASHDRIQRHMFVHGSDESKPLKCDKCNKRFLNNSALACHLKTHSTDKKNFECPMCKKSFDHVLQLKVHVPQHCEDGKYTCPHCKKIFKEYSIIRKHIRAFHCDRKHNCPHCAKPFPTLDKLRMHLLRHSDHREFLCANCGKQFKRKDKLKEHTKRVHSEERENIPKLAKTTVQNNKKFMPKVQPTDYHRFIYKCHACLVGFKRRGMLVNHLAKRHPNISPDSVPELNLPILRTTRDYYCQYCDKVYKSSSKRKAHILKNHPGQALPMSNRRQGSFPEVAGLPNPTFSQTVGSITTHPQACQWCHKQYASKAKLLQHQRKKHSELLQAQVQSKSDSRQNQVVSQEVEEITIDAHTFKRDFKVSDEELLVEVAALSDDREDEQYYHIISVPPNDSLNFNHTAELGHSADSRLYRLLTAGNGLLPPR